MHNLCQWHSFRGPMQYLPPATKLGQGYVFTGVCDSVHRGVSASVHAGIPPQQTPPRRRACWEIRSTRGRYASYWNALLLLWIFPIQPKMLTRIISNVLFSCASCLQIPSKKKNKKNEFDDFINDESSEEEDPIPKKRSKGKFCTFAVIPRVNSFQRL